MNKEDMKREIKELVEIAKICPPDLQEKCFELLFTSRFLQGKQIDNDGQVKSNPNDVNANLTIPADIARRLKTFAGTYGLTQEEILRIFTIDDTGNVSIEVTDLKTKKTSHKQKNLALLIGVRHQFMGGSFDVPTEELREMCVTYSTYDAANFGANLKNSKEIFAGYRFGATNKLSPKGKTIASELIKELAS